MSNDEYQGNGVNYDSVNEAFEYTFAGLASNTDGNEIISVTVQQADNDAYRVVARGYERQKSGVSVRVVAFTGGSDPAGCLLGFERAYRENLLRWHIDKYANGDGKNESSKAAKLKLMS